MSNTIEIYIRNTGDRTLLMFHVPENMKERLIDGIRSGCFKAQDTSINFECSILDDWKDEYNPAHMRISLSEITANYLPTDSEESE